MKSHRAHDVQPATAETLIAMEHLGVDHEAAKATLSEALPDDWAVCRAPNGEVYYHCMSTGSSQWAHPSKAWADGFEKDPEKLRKVVVPKGGEKRRRVLKGVEKTQSCSAEEPPSQHSIYDAQSRHVHLPTPQTLFSDGVVNVKREDLQGRALALHGLLTHAEAASYVSAAERTGFCDSDVEREFPQEIRQNSRIVHFSEALAAALWRRLAPSLAHRDIYLMQPMGFGAEGRWKPVGINPCFRISRYSEGGHFAPHYDGMFANANGECSIYSVVLYLNEDFDGGELELPGEHVFKPRAGSAVLFPHDMRHAGRPVITGQKYIARSELMFRCVDALALPSKPTFVTDPLFQKMAALYEQVGDLVAASAGADAITKTFQEALGIQIAHHGTLASSPAEAALPLPDKTLARALRFLPPKDMANCAVNIAWAEVSRLGVLWRCYFQRSWPTADELIENEARPLDPELKDWYGMYRQRHSLSKSRFCTVYLNSMVNMQLQDQEPLEPCPARVRHRDTGIGWDRSLKQRAGWSVGTRWAKKSWLDGDLLGEEEESEGEEVRGRRSQRARWAKKSEGEICWDALPEILAFAFQRLSIRQSEHRVIIPILPRLWTSANRARLAQILFGRFEVPKVHFVPAPLCALLAHNLVSGTVVWRCNLDKSMVCIFHELKLVGSVEFTGARVLRQACCPSEIVAALKSAAETLELGLKDVVLRNVVLSFQVDPEVDEHRSQASIKEGRQDPIPQTWTKEGQQDGNQEGMSEAFFSPQFIDAVKNALREDAPDSFSCSEFHAPVLHDVLLGARTLGASPELLARHEVVPEKAACFEWRQFADGQWQRLPPYVAGVLEGALRSGEQRALVQLDHYVRMMDFSHLHADLEAFTISNGPSLRLGGFGSAENGPIYKLTRFLRGCPSPVPDRRMPEDLERLLKAEVVEVARVLGTDALTVSTLTGKVVFSASRDVVSKMCVLDLVEEVGKNVHQRPARLSLLAGESALAPADTLQAYLEVEGPLELQVLIREPPPRKHSKSRYDEDIPEDVPGAHSDTQAVTFTQKGGDR